MRSLDTLRRFTNKYFDIISLWLGIGGLLVGLLSLLYSLCIETNSKTQITIPTWSWIVLSVVFFVCCAIFIYAKHLRKDYIKNLEKNNDFHLWHIDFLKNFYANILNEELNLSLTQINNRTFSNIAISKKRFLQDEYSQDIIFPKLIISSTEKKIKKELKEQRREVRYNSFGSKINLLKKLNRYRKEKLRQFNYALITWRGLGYGYNPGFILDSFDFSNCIWKLSCKLGNYKNTIFSSNFLEYELYCAYKNYNKKSIHRFKKKHLDYEYIVQDVPHRNFIHRKIESYDLTEATCGFGRSSLLSVQMMIVYYSIKDKTYKTIIQKRNAKTVSAKFSHYQFVPAGGFDVCLPHETLYSPINLRKQFDLKTIIYREILEELFNENDFQGTYGDKGRIDPYTRIYGSPQIKLLEELIRRGKAFLIQLGSAFDLVNLRHSISYLLFIPKNDDPRFEEELVFNMKFNDEFSFTNTELDWNISLRDLKIQLEEGNILQSLTSDSASLYKLFEMSPFIT